MGAKVASMTTFAKKLLLLAAFAMVVGTARAENGNFSVRRAINMADWFTWPRYEAAGGGIAWPPYKDERGAQDLATLKALREAGFDTVRLPVDPAPFIVFKDERRTAVYAMLFETLARIETAGLNAIIDIHPNSRHAVWGQNAVIASAEAPAFTAVEEVIGDMAGRLKGHTSRVALELLNEPRLKCKGREQALWQEMAQRLATKARSANPELTLIITGACISTPEGLMALDPAPFAKGRTVYTFHFYEPFSFTHQGAQFIPWPDKYLDGVPWPAHIRPISEPAALLEVQIETQNKLTYLERTAARAKAMHNLERYYAQKADQSLIDKRFREVANWAQEHGIAPQSIFIGEFGVLRREQGKPGAFCGDRARWLRDVRQTAESYGFAWSYFNYDGPFGLVKEGTRSDFDPSLLASLGLRPSCAVSSSAETSGQSDARGTAAIPPSCATLCSDRADGLARQQH